MKDTRWYPRLMTREEQQRGRRIPMSDYNKTTLLIKLSSKDLLSLLADKPVIWPVEINGEKMKLAFALAADENQ